jgi:aminocarboxymuconate-semialdehyde decarboxylase
MMNEDHESKIASIGELPDRTGSGGQAKPLRIDVHSHYVSKRMLDEIRRGGERCGTPYEDRAGVGIFVHTPERPYGPIKPAFHDLALRFEFMKRHAIDLQILLPPPFVFYYWTDAPEARGLMQMHNDDTAEAAKSSAGRLLGFGTVMLQHVQASIREIERIKRIGLLGVEIGSNVNGSGLDDPGLFDFYDAMQAYDLSLMIHPHNVAGQERMGDYHLRNLIGFPLDTTLAASQLIFSGVLDRFPNLRICLGQAGGFLPYIVGRLDAGYRARPECARNIKKPPSEYLTQFFYDSIIHSSNSSAFLIDTIGSDRVMLGSDFPFDMNAASPVAEIEAHPRLSREQRAAVYQRTATAFLGLHQIDHQPAMSS